MAWILLAIVLFVALSLFAQVMSLLGAIFGIITYVLFAHLMKKVISLLDDGMGDEDFYNILKNVVALPPALLIAMTSPFWNTTAYCNFVGSDELLIPLIEMDIQRCIENVSGFIDSGLGLHSGFLTMTYWMNGILVAGLFILIILFVKEEFLLARREGKSFSEWFEELKNDPDAPWNKKKET